MNRRKLGHLFPIYLSKSLEKIYISNIKVINIVSFFNCAIQNFDTLFSYSRFVKQIFSVSNSNGANSIKKISFHWNPNFLSPLLRFSSMPLRLSHESTELTSHTAASNRIRRGRAHVGLVEQSCDSTKGLSNRPWMIYSQRLAAFIP